MAQTPIPIQDISDPTQIRVKLLASGQEVHAPMTAVASASIHGATAKTTPADADEFPLADSADSYAVKKITWANIKAATWTALGALINGGTGKTTPVDGDMFAIADSAASNATKKLTWANLKATFVATANTWSAVQTFSAIPVLSGGAISFPATQVASASANDLDDYEEASWTAGFAFGGGTTGLTYGTRAARSVKIGQLVIAAFDVALTAKGSSTGVATVTGLPYTSLNDGMIGSMSISFYSGMSGLTGAITGYVNLNGTTGQFVQTGATGVTNLTETSFTNTSRIVGTAIYRAA